MNDGPEWFAPKRYGYGSGPPISWQGWALILLFILILFALSRVLGNRPTALIAAIIPLTAIFLVICARTTRGGWRWRWGEKD